MSDPSQKTPTGVAKGAPAPKTPSERDLLMADLDARIAEARIKDDEEFLATADPRAAALYAEMGREAKGREIQADSQTGREDALTEVEAEAIDDGEQQAEDDAAAREAAAAVRISTKGADPLAEYVVRQDGKAMFKTVVDGKQILIPLDKARAQLQKHLAADARLMQAAEQKRQLDAREAQLRQTEATLQARARQAEATPIDDEALDTEASELVRALVSRPEAEAAKAMAATLKKVRQATPRINEEAIVARAKAEAKQEIAESEHRRALDAGFSEFTTAYPDIAADSELFATADRKTDAIAAEHPEWSPGKVMMEAGKQTRDWMKSVGIATRPSPRAPNEPNNRQVAKSKLQPMPQSRSVRPAPAEDANAADDPLGYVAALRKSRGME
jgi:hypothetical protein